MDKDQMSTDQRADRDKFFTRLSASSWDSKENFNTLFEEGFSVPYQAVLSYKNKFGTLKAKYSVDNIAQIRLDIETKKFTVPVTILFEVSSSEIVDFLISRQKTLNSPSIKENLETLANTFGNKVKVNIDEEFKILDSSIIRKIVSDF